MISVQNQWKPLVFISFYRVSLENHWFPFVANANQWKPLEKQKTKQKNKFERLVNGFRTSFGLSWNSVSSCVCFVFVGFSNGFHWFVLETNENQSFSNEACQKLMKTNGFHIFLTELNENPWFSLLFDAFHWKTTGFH